MFSNKKVKNNIIFEGFSPERLMGYVSFKSFWGRFDFYHKLLFEFIESDIF